MRGRRLSKEMPPSTWASSRRGGTGRPRPSETIFARCQQMTRVGPAHRSSLRGCVFPPRRSVQLARACSKRVWSIHQSGVGSLSPFLEWPRSSGDSTPMLTGWSNALALPPCALESSGTRTTSQRPSAAAWTGPSATSPTSGSFRGALPEAAAATAARTAGSPRTPVSW